MNKFCPVCGGDGRETCSNPDHGLILITTWKDMLNGCPICGHDPKHKVPGGADCEACIGRGVVSEDRFKEIVEEYQI